jgi:hypothetical protein
VAVEWSGVACGGVPGWRWWRSSLGAWACSGSGCCEEDGANPILGFLAGRKFRKERPIVSEMQKISDLNHSDELHELGAENGTNNVGFGEK